MKQKEFTLHSAVITETVLENVHSTVANYMEDVLEFDPYMDGYSEVHDMLFFECVKTIGNFKFQIK